MLFGIGPGWPAKAEDGHLIQTTIGFRFVRPRDVAGGSVFFLMAHKHKAARRFARTEANPLNLVAPGLAEKRAAIAGTQDEILFHIELAPGSAFVKKPVG